VLVLLAFLAVSVVASASTPGSARADDFLGGTRAAPASARELAAPTPPATPRFVTLPPGSKLPGDQACASAVCLDAETDPENKPFNAVAGTRRLPASFFPPGSGDPRAAKDITARVTGAYKGTTPQILQWVACKWGVDERLVSAQAWMESTRRQNKLGDWTRQAAHCAPRHGLGVDGRPGQCPESFGILQVRYRFFSGAFPDTTTSSAFNLDTAYAVWRACYEGREWWLQDAAVTGRRYAAGDAWGCIGRWYSGEWYGPSAEPYIACAKQLFYGRKPCS